MFSWIGNIYRNKMQAKAARKGISPPARREFYGSSRASLSAPVSPVSRSDDSDVGASYLYGSSLSLHGLSDSSSPSWSGGGGVSGGGGASASWSDSCSSSNYDSGSSSYDIGSSSDSGSCGGSSD